MKSLTSRERIVVSLILSLAAFVFMFMSLQIAYYERYIPIEPFFKPEVAPLTEDLEIDPNDISFDNSEENLKSLARDMNDNRSMSENNYKQNPYEGDPTQRIKDFEKQLFGETNGQLERDKIKQEMNQRNQNSKDPNDKNPNKGDKSNNGSDTQYSGDVMVEFKLDGRSAYDNNLWYVRNPGYTCGYGSSGKVVIKISVDKSGKVLSAQYDSDRSNGANPCMIEQSLKYAKKSKFNYKDNAPGQQSGVIVYKFVAQ